MNKNGNRATLVASHPANSHALRHGAYASKSLPPRAAEIRDVLLRLEHVSASLDAIGIEEISRLLAIIEAVDADLHANGVTQRGDARALLKVRATLSRRLEEWLACFALTPRSRAEFFREAANGKLAAEIAQRRAQEETKR